MKDFVRKCRELIDPKYKKYTDEQIKQIHEYLDQLVKLNIQLIMDKKTGKVINP